MSTPDFTIVQGSNLSDVWARVFLTAMEPPNREMALLIATIRGFKAFPDIDRRIENHLDLHLRSVNPKLSVRTVANTVFPRSLWDGESTARSRQSLYQRYERIWPQISRDPANRHGTYFRRLTCWPDRDREGAPRNQLENLIQIVRSGTRRRSAYQLSVWDPTIDQVNTARRGFPCLQHVVFGPDGETGWSVTGFYAMQYVFERAYGNYLGLARLGHFVALSVGRELTRVNCVASIAQRGSSTKASMQPLATVLEKMITT